ncbi:uncharacterized protein LOC133805547 [Humulus lupulus]|uniref:uncharacterized protein LOC133805547 n=1 Tax=Humulus lupulus TaxID=3486 RepID=UPI002B402817|nr:uncharacterized protein LOC133805547 [Humulus lupulus]
MVCLCGTTYSLMMNGRIHGRFKGEKGLRQGDTISPLLFVWEFCDALGLSANKSKSHIYFGGVDEASKQRMLAVVNIEEGSFPLKYLGIQLRPTKWKASDCGPIIRKIQLKLYTWASRHLSFSGRAQLIQSVLIGIRSYWKSIFLLPQKQVCLPKDYGGIGFREGNKWNKTLLAKYAWAISTKHDCLWKLAILRTYFMNEHVLDAAGRFKVRKFYNSLLQCDSEGSKLVGIYRVAGAFLKVDCLNKCFIVLYIDAMIRRANEARVLLLHSHSLNNREQAVLDFVARM